MTYPIREPVPDVTVHDVRIRTDVSTHDDGPETEIHIEVWLVLYCLCGEVLARTKDDLRAVVVARLETEHMVKLVTR